MKNKGGSRKKMEAAEAEYFSKDFEWDELRAEVENDPSFRYHLLPYESSTIPSSQTTTRATTAKEEDSTANSSRFSSFHQIPLRIFFCGSSFIFLYVHYWVFGCRESLGNVSKPKGNWVFEFGGGWVI